MTASRTAAIAALQKITGCEDVVSVFNVVIFAFDELGWAIHDLAGSKQIPITDYQIPLVGS